MERTSFCRNRAGTRCDTRRNSTWFHFVPSPNHTRSTPEHAAASARTLYRTLCFCHARRMGAAVL